MTAATDYDHIIAKASAFATEKKIKFYVLSVKDYSDDEFRIMLNELVC